MSNIETIQSQKSFQYLKEVETLAQDILSERQQKLELSNAENKFRESLRALETAGERSTWMKVGSIYIERPTSECKEILKSEIEKVKQDLDNLHVSLKAKRDKLRDLEHEPRVEGVTLKPMSAAEMKGLNMGFGLNN